MAHLKESSDSLKRRYPQSDSIPQWPRGHVPGVPSTRTVDPDIQRTIDRINRLNALVSADSDDGEEREFDRQSFQHGNFDFPLLSSGWGDPSVQPAILQNISEMMREMDPSRALFESDIRDTLPKTQIPTLLPPYEETRSLLDGYLQHFNSIFPLFQESTLRRLVSRLYTQQQVLDPGSRASGYAVIAVAFKLRLWNTGDTNKIAAAAWMYFNVAMRLLPEISVAGDNAECNFRNIQALSAMAMFLQGSMQFNDAPKLLENAIRQANVFDPNQNALPNGVCPLEVQQTRRVLYVLDKEFSLHSGLPPMIRMVSHNADYMKPGGNGVGNAIQHFCSLAVIEERIYEELYSVTAQERPGLDLLGASFELEQKLKERANQLPYYVRNDGQFSSQSSEAILLSLMFNNCLITIHRLPAIHCPKTGVYSRYAGTNSVVAHRIRLAKRTRTTAALSCIYSVQKLQIRGLFPFWLLPSPIVVSLILLLTTMLYDLECSPTNEIIEAIDSGVMFMHLINDKSCGEFSQTLQIATGVAKVARKLQQKGQDDIAARNIAQVALENAVMELRRGMRPRKHNKGIQKQVSPFRGTETPSHRSSAWEEPQFDLAGTRLHKEGPPSVPIAAQLDPWESLSWIGELGSLNGGCEWDTGHGVALGLPEPIIWDDFISGTSNFT